MSIIRGYLMNAELINQIVKKIFDTNYLIGEEKHGPEPTIRQMMVRYYTSGGFISKEEAEQYIIQVIQKALDNLSKGD